MAQNSFLAYAFKILFLHNQQNLIKKPSLNAL